MTGAGLLAADVGYGAAIFVSIVGTCASVAGMGYFLWVRGSLSSGLKVWYLTFALPGGAVAFGLYRGVLAIAR